MNTRRKLAVVPGEPRPVASTAHQGTITAVGEGRVTRRRSSSWDPYEVWKTRVKGDQAPEDDAESAPAA